MATDAEAKALGLSLPAPTDLIAGGDDAISNNARVTVDLVRAAEATGKAAAATAEANAKSYADTAAAPPPALSTFGDSITAAGQGGGIKWHELVSDWLGIPAYNPSVPGESPADIATRQGGLAPALTLTGNAIPPEVTPVTVTVVSPSSGWITNSPGNPDRGVFRGRLHGVPGTLAHNQSTGAWTFTRTTAGTVPIPCPPSSPFRVDESKAHRGDIQTFWGGRNDNSTVLRDTRSMVAYLHEPRRFLVLSILTGGADHKDAPGYPGIISRNGQLATEWPDNYVDMRRFLIDEGLAVAGLTPTSQDEIDIAGDTVPTSLRADNVHPNAAGHYAIGWKIATELVTRGWVDPATAVIPGSAEIPGGGTAVKGLRTTDSASTATIPAPVELVATQSLSVQVRLTPDALGMNMQPVRRVTGTDQRAWTFYVLSDGRLRWQTFQSGTSTPNEMSDSSVAHPFAAGQTFSLRVDHDGAARTVTFYTSENGTTWTQLGTVRPVTSGGIFTSSTAPVTVGGAGLVGTVQSVKVSPLTGVNPYVQEDFTDGTAAGWTLTGSATLV